MKPAALAACLLTAASAAFPAGPQPARDEIRCKDSGTTQEMNVCAKEAFDAADRQLNETYQALLRKEAGHPQFLKLMRQAQKAWIAFRDAELAAAFACEEDVHTRCWGTMYTMDYLFLKKRLTDERRARLQAMIDQPRPALATP